MNTSYSITVFGNKAVFIFLLLYIPYFWYFFWRTFDFSLSFISLVYILYGLFYWICSLVIQLKKVNHIELHSEKLVLYGKELLPHHIRKIRVSGYFLPAIHILPYKGFHIARFPFRFHKKDDIAIKQLIQWAKQHDVPINYQKYHDL